MNLSNAIGRKELLFINERKVRRGDIYYADLNPVIGSEQGNCRPVIVISNNKGNEHSPTVIITPVTASLFKSPLPTHVPLSQSCGFEKNSLALTEQIRAIDRSRLGNYIGHAGKSAMLLIDEALLICVGIKRRSKEPVFVSLCSHCEKDFRGSGYVLVKKSWQKIKTQCDFCGVHGGLVFGILIKG